MAAKDTLIVALIVLTCVDTGLAVTYYLEDYCTSGGIYNLARYVGGSDSVNINSQRVSTYQSNLNCTITLYTNAGKYLSLTSLSMNLENAVDCIKLFDGQYTSSPSVSHCTNDQLTYVTTQKYLTIQMTTDSSVNRAGFRLRVRSTSTDVLPCASSSYFGQYQCRNGIVCYSDYQTCDGRPTCGDKTDELNCDHCTDGAFHCQSSRQCVSSYKVCDDTSDCLYGEDENLPECHPSIWLYWTGGQVAGLVIGYIIFLVIVIAIVVAVHTKCK